MSSVKKQDFINKKAGLKIERNKFKKEFRQKIKIFKIQQKNEFKVFKSSNPTKEGLKNKKGAQEFELYYYKLEEGKQLNYSNSQIKQLKFEFTTSENENWKLDHMKLVESNKANFDERYKKIEIKLNTKIQNITNRHESTILNKNSLIKQHRDEAIKLENEFVKNISYIEDQNILNYLSVIQYTKDEKIKVKVRLIKRKVRLLNENFEEKLTRLESIKKFKLEKQNIKYQNKLHLDKPFSKLFWVNHVLKGVTNGASKFEGQRHINALKMGLIHILPLILIGAFWILLNNVILSTSEGGLLHLFGLTEDSVGLANFKIIGNNINMVTMGMMGLLMGMTMSAVLGERLGIGRIESGLLGIVLFFSFVPMFAVSINDSNSVVIKMSDLGTGGMFLAIVTSLVGVELYNAILKVKFLKIKMPAQVPPAIARSFNVLIPWLMTTFIFASASFSLLFFAHKNLIEVIQLIIEKPLSSGFESLYGLLSLRLIMDIFWALGLHGQNMVAPIFDPIGIAHVVDNADLVSQGLEPKWIVTKVWLDSYFLMQYNLLVVISLFLFSKRKDNLSIMAVAALPSLFNISEPIVFGLPLILNPIMAIPMILGNQIMAIFAYTTMDLGFGTPAYIQVPWTTPAILGPYLSGGGDIKNAIVALGMASIGILVYWPFIVISNKQATTYNPELIVKRFSYGGSKVAKIDKAKEYINQLKNKISII